MQILDFYHKHGRLLINRHTLAEQIGIRTHELVSGTPTERTANCSALDAWTTYDPFKPSDVWQFVNASFARIKPKICYKKLTIKSSTLTSGKRDSVDISRAAPVVMIILEGLTLSLYHQHLHGRPVI